MSQERSIPISCVSGGSLKQAKNTFSPMTVKGLRNVTLRRPLHNTKALSSMRFRLLGSFTEKSLFWHCEKAFFPITRRPSENSTAQRSRQQRNAQRSITSTSGGIYTSLIPEYSKAISPIAITGSSRCSDGISIFCMLLSSFFRYEVSA